MADGLKEIVAGSVAGSVGKLFEYPLDTTKVRLQAQSLTAPQYAGALDCLRQTLRHEGVTGLYRGLSAPMVGAAAENAVLFSTFATFDSALQRAGVDGGTTRALAAGSLSGLAASFVLTPIELVKCQVQINAGTRPRGIWHHVKDTWALEGARGFWRGQTGTALREGGGSAAWFGTYHALRDSVGPLAAGAAAGVAYNLSLFPADTIKSRMQTDRLRGHPPLSFWKTGAELIHTIGVRGLYRGCLVTCLRAVPSNAVIFSVHDYVQHLMNGTVR